MLKALIVLHRYVGVLVGILMTLWCLSGFVMMYQSFPELTQVERLRGLEPLNIAGCCDLSRLPIPDSAQVTEARLEMTAGAPVLRLSVAGEKPALFDLTGTRPRLAFTDAETLAVAHTFAERSGIKASPRSLGIIGYDQWSVAAARRNSPVHKVDLGDAAGTVIYVSGATGEVFQDSNRRERLLSWFGAVPHWLYPTVLRNDPTLWTQVVIWTSTVGVFLTVTGLYVGIARIGKGRAGAVSPYKGLWFWHHMTGLVFGVLTLTWVFSGLLTMTPWGLFESNTGDLRHALNGSAPWSQVKAALQSPPPGSYVQLTATPLAGEVRLIATNAAGLAKRFDAAASPLPVGRGELQAALQRTGHPAQRLELIDREDAYYYGHHGQVTLPVWRVTLAGKEAARLYLDPQSGRVLRAVDPAARGSRWFSSALHDFDWPVIRRRPIWDLVVLPLLLGVTALCAIGAWLGILRIRLDFRAIRYALRRQRRAAPS